MFAEFYSLEWKKGEVEFTNRKSGEKKKSGFAKEIKRNQDGTVTYMVPKKSQYILTVKAENGQFYTEDVYGVIKYYNKAVRITKEFRSKFETYMSNQQYVVNDKGFISGIYNSIETFFLKNVK